MPPKKGKSPQIEKVSLPGPSALPSTPAAPAPWDPSEAPKEGPKPWNWYDSKWSSKLHLRGPDNFEIWLQRVHLQMAAFGWEKGDEVSKKDDIRLAMYLSQIMEPDTWNHVSHLDKGTMMIDQLKAVYRGEASYAKLKATRALGQVRMRKSESVTDFQARFNGLVRADAQRRRQQGR